MPARATKLSRRTALKGSLSIGAVVPLAACKVATVPGPLCVKPPLPAGEWNNAVTSLQPVKPALLAYPDSAAAIVSLVKTAEAKGQRVRMTGSGHSFSDVAITDDVLLQPNRIAKFLDLDPRRLKPDARDDRHLVRVESGITIRDLNAALDGKGLALANLGGFDGQTIAGVAMTATHGSGLSFGPIASQLKSLQIVTAGGRMLQIEPTNGVSDPASFPGVLEEDNTIVVELVQSDNYFDAVSVSMGCMGVVYAAIIETVDRFWLQEKRQLVTWRDLARPGGYLEALVARPRDPYFADHVEVTINPYPIGPNNPDHYCILTQRRRFAARPPKTPTSKSRGLVGNGDLLTQPMVRQITEDNLLQVLDTSSDIALSDELTGFLVALADVDYSDLSYKVFNIGGANCFRAFGIEMAFDLSQTIAATERMFQLAAEDLKAGRHHSVPVTLRFVKATSAPLAMQYGRDTMMMEIGMLVRARGAEELLTGYETKFIDELRARPHWGLDLSILRGTEQLARLYPAWNVWHDVFKELNGSGTFDGRLTDRLGISIHPRR